MLGHTPITSLAAAFAATALQCRVKREGPQAPADVDQVILSLVRSEQRQRSCLKRKSQTAECAFAAICT